MYCIEESTCVIVGNFWRPRSDSAPGELCPPYPLGYAPGSTCYLRVIFNALVYDIGFAELCAFTTDHTGLLYIAKNQGRP